MKLNTITAILLLSTAGTAFAHGTVSCPAVAKDDMKPQIDLQRKLEAEGWKVRQVKNYKGCYEVYGLDSKGEKIEAFFDPKSLDRVHPQAAGK